MLSPQAPAYESPHGKRQRRDKALSVMDELNSKKFALLQHATTLRGVPVQELETRLARAQTLMKEAEVDFLLLTTQEDFYYFTGLYSRFWHSPTRPYYLLIPCTGTRPFAVIPSIMTEVLCSRTWIPAENVCDWPSPRLGDDGITELVQTMASLPCQYQRAGFMLGHESVMRMPVADVDCLRASLGKQGITTVDASRVMRELRLVKSPFEVERIRHACTIGSAAFQFLPARLDMLQEAKAAAGQGGVTVRDARNEMRALMMEFGADDTPYVMTQAGNNGYDNIILEPEDEPLRPGDVLVIDTGACFEMYWCDFDRNFVVGGEGSISAATKKTQDLVWLATEAGFEVCRNHGTSSDICRAMSSVMGIQDNSTGRLGHGLGLHITEHFSNNATDEEPLRPGMVLTLEPGMLVLGDDKRMIVHEEDVLITEEGAEYLTQRAPRRFPSILESRSSSAQLEEVELLRLSRLVGHLGERGGDAYVMNGDAQLLHRSLTSRRVGRDVKMMTVGAPMRSKM